MDKYKQAYNTSINLGHCEVFAETYAKSIASGEGEFFARDTGYKKLREIFAGEQRDGDWIEKIEKPDENEMMVYYEALNECKLSGKSELFSKKYAEYVRLMTFIIPIYPGYCFSDSNTEEPITKVAEEFARKYVMAYIKSIETEGRSDRYFPLFEMAKESTKIGRENQRRFENEVIHKFTVNFTKN
jgi:hypothetical protein